MARDQAKISRDYRARLKAAGRHQVVIDLPKPVVEMLDAAAVARGETRVAVISEILSKEAPKLVETAA